MLALQSTALVPADRLGNACQHKMQTKLDAIERVRAHLEGTDVKVTCICVIGMQSSGKSSVLESMTGISFPRGDGMCTRCVCIVSLETDPTQEPIVICATNATYDENKTEVSDMSSVGSHIAKLTEIVAPTGVISEKPIYVKIRRKAGPTLTLCDIPGITNMSAWQEDVEEVTVRLTEKYASNENALLLCVVPAADDFQNSKAMQIAKKLDETGERTIGVVTKVDCLPPGSDLLRKMRQERENDVKLKHGFVAVRNRSQEEVEEELSAEDAKAKETEIFETHPILKQLDPGQRGIDDLVDKMVAEQARLVDAFVPAAIMELMKKRARGQEELLAMPKACDTDEAKRAVLVKATFMIHNDFRKLVEADALHPLKQIHVSARFLEAAETYSATSREAMPDFLSDECRWKIEERLKETIGFNMSNFLDGPTFQHQFNGAFEKPLAIFASNLVEFTVTLVTNALGTVIKERCTDWPALGAALTRHVGLVVSDRAKELNKLLQAVIDAELAGTWTLNHYYSQTIQKFREAIHEARDPRENVYDLEVPEDLTEEFFRQAASESRTNSNSAAAVREMQVSLRAYQKVVEKRVFDTIGALVRHHLVLKMRDDVAEELNSLAPKLAPTIEENQAMAAKRQRLVRDDAKYEAALEELRALS